MLRVILGDKTAGLTLVEPAVVANREKDAQFGPNLLKFFARVAADVGRT